MLFAAGLGSLVAGAFTSPEVELTESSTAGSEPCTLFVGPLLKRSFLRSDSVLNNSPRSVSRDANVLMRGNTGHFH